MEVENSSLNEKSLEDKANDLKNEGNEFIKKGEYENAVNKYKEALELSNNGPNSHIFFCNLACALSFLKKYDESIEACKKSLELKEDYAKSYSRLGYAYTKLEKYQEAKENYEKALELNSSLESAKKSLENLNKKIQEKENIEEIDTDNSLNGLENLMAGLGGGNGLSDMFNNPEMMKMAQSMMGNPQMMQMAQSMMGNPNMMNNMMNNPEMMNNMMKNPEMMNMAQNMMKNPEMMNMAKNMMNQ